MTNHSLSHHLVLSLAAAGLFGFTLPAGIAAAQGTTKTIPPTLTQQVSLAEYQVSWHDRTPFEGLEQAYLAPNRAQDLRFAFTPAGLRLQRRAEPDWEGGLRLAEIGSEAKKTAASSAELLIDGASAVYSSQDAQLRLLNSARGLELRLRITRAPTAGEELHVVLESTGELSFRLNRLGRPQLRSTTGDTLRFTQFEARDALDSPLVCRFEAGKRAALNIRVASAEAVYPIELSTTLKGLSNAADFVVEASIGDLQLGYSVATAGDVNGDGYSDIIVGIPGYSGPLGQQQGLAMVYHGGPSGPGSPPVADWTEEGPSAYSSFGASVATAGDVNGDGFADVIIGAPGLDGDGLSNVGGVYVYLGSVSGLAETPVWYSTGNQDGAQRGFCVAGVGDVNGDTRGDIIFSEPFYDSSSDNDVGRVFVFNGSSSGIADSGFAPVGTESSGKLGYSVAGAGDVNGDGFADVVIGIPWASHGSAPFYPFAGEVRVYPGSSTGLSTASFTSITQDVESLTLGRAVSTAGDVNGDGYADIIISSHIDSSGWGSAFVHLGSSSGVDSFFIWRADGYPNDALGASVAYAGDVNGDGFADLLIGAPSAGSTLAGEAYAWFGTTGGPASYGDGSFAQWGAGAEYDGESYGACVATAGDVNGDGYADILVADPDFGSSDGGRVYGYFGGPDSLDDTPAWNRFGEQQGAQLGVSVATAGDVNGDGLADIAVGAEYYDSGFTDEGAVFVWHGTEGGLSFAGPDWLMYGGRDSARFGHSVASAGDVNNDGYSDLVIGAPGYANPTFDEGAAFLFAGGPSGLNGSVVADAVWKAEIDDYSAHLGWSVASAGDVNDDGYADVVVGAPGAGPSSQGRAFVWHGGASGLGSDGSSANADWSWTGSTDYGLFGRSVASAGDVDRDGYADLAVGGDELVVVWHGSSSGLSSAASSWSYASSDLEDNDLGASVAAAGDFDGDGFSDLAVGAPLTDSDPFTADDGAVLVFCGSAGGLAGSPCFSDFGGVAEANLGSSVASAGDLDGDGYADLVAGARHFSDTFTWQGQVRVYYGSWWPGGGADWSYSSGLEFAFLGHAVAGAGDVNGDGFSDLLVGAPGATDSLTGEGMALLFYGNDEVGHGDGGRSLVSQPLNLDNSPIAPRGTASLENGMRLHHQVHPPAGGRDRIAIECEHKSMVVPLDGTLTTTTPSFDSGVATSSLIQEFSGMLPTAKYRWRCRVVQWGVSNPQQAPAGRWFSPPYAGLDEAKVRAAGNSSPASLFSDDFELGNLSRWSSSVGAGS